MYAFDVKLCQQYNKTAQSLALESVLDAFQAMLAMRGALHRFNRVNKIANKEKDNITIDN